MTKAAIGSMNATLAAKVRRSRERWTHRMARNAMGIMAVTVPRVSHAKPIKNPAATIHRTERSRRSPTKNRRSANDSTANAVSLSAWGHEDGTYLIAYQRDESNHPSLFLKDPRFGDGEVSFTNLVSFLVEELTIQEPVRDLRGVIPNIQELGEIARVVRANHLIPERASSTDESGHRKRLTLPSFSECSVAPSGSALRTTLCPIALGREAQHWRRGYPHGSAMVHGFPVVQTPAPTRTESGQPRLSGPPPRGPDFVWNNNLWMDTPRSRYRTGIE